MPIDDRQVFAFSNRFPMSEENKNLAPQASNLALKYKSTKNTPRIATDLATVRLGVNDFVYQESHSFAFSGFRHGLET